MLPEIKFGAGAVPRRGMVWYNGVEKCGGADAAARFGAKAESLLWRLGFLPRPNAGGRGMERKKGGNSL